MHPEIRERLPVLILMGLIVCTSIYDWNWGLAGWMAVPNDITAAWQSAMGGDFSGDVIGDLASTLGAAFLHGDSQHLVGNLLFFWIFGAVVHELCGWRWFLTIFVLTAIGGSVGQLLLDPYNPIPGVGASGAVMGFEGAYLGFAVQKTRPEAHVWPLARPVTPAELAAVGVFGVMLDFMGVIGPPLTNIAYGAHIGGFATGILVSFLRRD